MKSSRRNLDLDAPANLLSDDYVENEGLSHSRSHSIRTGVAIAAKLEMKGVEVQTEREAYEKALQEKKEMEALENDPGIVGLMQENEQLREQLRGERDKTKLQRESMEAQLEAERSANMQNIEALENQSNDISA